MSEVRYSIHAAVPQDAKAIADVHVAAWQDTYAGILPTRYLTRMSARHYTGQWHHRLCRTSSPGKTSQAVLVAKDEDGRVLGYGSSGPCRDDYFGGPGQLGAAEVHTLYVHPDYIDQGIGRALLTHVFRYLVEAKCDRAILWALADNPNHFFYRAMGGTLQAERNSHYWGRSLWEVGYVWPNLSMWVAAAQSVRSTSE